MMLLRYFKKNREDEKQIAINGILNELFNNNSAFSHAEQTEILNRVTVNVMERKRENLSRLVKEARELKNSMLEIKI